MQKKKNELDKGAPGNPTQDADKQRALGPSNFLIMGISALLIVVGFVLMTGSESTVEQYNPDIFSSRRIVVGPMLSFFGFVLMAVAIIVKPRAIKDMLKRK